MTHGWRAWWTIVLTTAIAACTGPTAPSTQSFSGHWVGTYLVRQCTPAGWPSCEGVLELENHTYPLDLMLTQTGSSVSGTAQITESAVWAMTASGSATQNTLTIAGSATEPLNRVSTDLVRITRWLTTRADDGTMRGTFSFHRETLWGPANMQHPVGELWTLSYEAELLNVARRP
jgi:hypothetical protein